MPVLVFRLDYSSGVCRCDSLFYLSSAIKRARQCDRGKDRLVAFRMWPPRNVVAKSASETSNLRTKTFDIDTFGIISIALVSF